MPLSVLSLYEKLPSRICLFESIVRKAAIRFGYEQLANCKSKIVPEDSAILDIKSETKFAAECTHSSICKFSSAESPAFLTIASNIARFIRQGPVSDNARVFLPCEPSPYFTGRRHYLQQIYESMHVTQRKTIELEGPGSDHNLRVVLLYGEEGLGKTEIALKYASEQEHKYSYIFFAESASRRTLETELVALHGKLTLPHDPGREVQNFRNFLVTEPSWLFIIDSDDDFIALDFLGLPDSVLGHIIITSRLRDHSVDPRLQNALKIESFSKTDAAEFLYSRLGLSAKDRQGCESDAQELAQQLGRLPISVETAGAWIISNSSSISKCLRAVAGPWPVRMFLETLPHSKGLSFEAILQKSLDAIRIDPDAHRLLHVLVWLDRTRTTRTFLKRAASNQRRWDSNGEPVNRTPEESFVPKDLVQLINSPSLENAIDKLQSYSLIASDERTGKIAPEESSVVTHPITYKYIREQTLKPEMIHNIACALSLVVQAHPVLHGGLERE